MNNIHIKRIVEGKCTIFSLPSVCNGKIVREYRLKNDKWIPTKEIFCKKCGIRYAFIPQKIKSPQ